LKTTNMATNTFSVITWKGEKRAGGGQM